MQTPQFAISHDEGQRQKFYITTKSLFPLPIFNNSCIKIYMFLYGADIVLIDG